MTHLAGAGRQSPSGEVSAGPIPGAVGRSIALVVAAVIATSPLGEGGRAADVLLVHHSLLALAIAWLAARRSPLLRGSLPLVAIATSFAVYGWLLAPYRYSALLVVADVTAAIVLAFLAARATAAGEERLLGVGVVVAALVSGGRGWLELRAGQPVRGFFANPNHAAALVAAAGAWLLALALDASGSRASRVRAAVGAGAALAFVVASGSKGGLLALSVGAALALVRAGGGRFVLALTAVVALAVVLPTPVGERIRREPWADPHAVQRPRIWWMAMRMAGDHLLVGGVGLGAFDEMARRYNFPVSNAAVGRYGKFAHDAHNEYLTWLAEASLPGLAILVLPAAVAIRRIRAAGRRSHPGAVAGLAALLTQAAVDGVLRSPANLYVLAALLGVLLARGARSEAPERPWARPVTLVLVATLWAGAVYLPWAGDRSFQAFLRTGAASALARARRQVPGHAGYVAAAAASYETEFFRTGKLEHLDQALRLLIEAERLDPLEPRRPARLASLRHRAFLEVLPARELAEAALEDYRRALAAAPFNPFLRIDRARLLAAVGRPAEAVAEAERAARIEPDCRLAQEALARLRHSGGDEAGAAAARREMARIDALARTLQGGSRYDRTLLGLVEPEAR